MNALRKFLSKMLRVSFSFVSLCFVRRTDFFSQNKRALILFQVPKHEKNYQVFSQFLHFIVCTCQQMKQTAIRKLYWIHNSLQTSALKHVKFYLECAIEVSIFSNVDTRSGHLNVICLSFHFLIYRYWSQQIK